MANDDLEKEEKRSERDSSQWEGKRKATNNFKRSLIKESKENVGIIYCPNGQ